MDGQANIDLDRSRSETELLGVTFKLYGRYPLLFPILAAAVVVPYLLVILLITGDGPFEYRTNLPFVTRELLGLTSLILVWPMVSALHVHAARDVAEGGQPRFVDIARRGLVALPVVTAAVAISWIGTLLGFLALIVPGLLLWMRWSVVAQAATLERGSWIDALRRSADLTRDLYLHVFGLLLMLGVTVGIPSFLIGLPFRHSDPTVGSFLIGALVQILANSFGALGSAVLYFDLKARLVEREALPAPALPGPRAGFSGRGVEPTGDRLDPESWPDEDRPPGWYIDLENTSRMRYWGADGTQAWSERRAKTPRAIQKEFARRRRVGGD